MASVAALSIGAEIVIRWRNLRRLRPQ